LKNKKKIDLVILAGGFGTRIKKYLKGKPKPMIKFDKFNFLDLLIRKICTYDINKVYILAGYKGQKIKRKYHNKKINLVDIECIVEKKPRGTAGCLNQIKKKLTTNFIVVNGDTFFDIDYNQIINFNLRDNKSFISLAKNKNYKSNKKLINLNINNNKIVYSKSSYINGGIYKFKKTIFKYIIKYNCSLENDILPELIKSKKVSGKKFNDFFLDIGTPKNLIYAKRRLISYLRRPAVFLDRDGTINEDFGYTHQKKDLKFRKGVINGLQKLQKKSFQLFIITNQAGIGKGFFDLNKFYKFQQFMKSYLIKKNIFVNDIEFCPYHPDATIKKYKKQTNLRKPGNLMIKNILNKWPINLSRSVMIGDQKSDYLCAKKSNIKFYYTEKDFTKIVSKIKV
tara:strand:+ start:1753 stop:2940 length:1188 start_codon:yes stop_codon:yes gene_type:complete